MFNSSKLRLYRGDYEKIDEFDFHKTNKHCLVGPGVYLTSKATVAETYRTKGKPYHHRAPDLDHELFSGAAKDRSEAIDKGFERFYNSWWPHHFRPKGPFNKATDEAKAREFYKFLRDEGKLKAEYTTVQNAWNSTKGPMLKVTLAGVEGYEPPGYVSVFDFEATHFNSSVLKVERDLTPDIREVLLDANVKLVSEHTDVPIRIARRSPPIPRSGVLPRPLASLVSRIGYSGIASQSMKIRSALEPYGYIGFEYDGGTITAGIRHRAFCIWNDEYVNRHRTQIRK